MTIKIIFCLSYRNIGTQWGGIALKILNAPAARIWAKNGCFNTRCLERRLRHPQYGPELLPWSTILQWFHAHQS